MKCGSLWISQSWVYLIHHPVWLVSQIDIYSFNRLSKSTTHFTFCCASQESILKGRFSPSGRIEGFTAEIGASGSYCPQHVTLPVQVTYYDISEHSAPSPFLVSVCVCVCFVLCFYVVVYILSQERKKDKRNVCCGLLVGEKNKPNLEIRTTKTMRVSDWCWFASSQADVENVFLCICYDAVLQFIGK